MNELQSLLVRGMADFGVLPEDMLREIARGVETGEYKVFIIDNAAFCVLSMPQRPFENPQVLHFYSEKPGLRQALLTRMMDYIKSKGYNKFIAINGSSATDKVWTRAFRHDGWKINPVKTVFEFEVVK